MNIVALALERLLSPNWLKFISYVLHVTSLVRQFITVVAPPVATRLVTVHLMQCYNTTVSLKIVFNFKNLSIAEIKLYLFIKIDF